MTLTLAPKALTALRTALPEAVKTSDCRVGPLSPVSLTVEGNARARRLRLVVDIYLIASADASPVRLRGQLVSDAWSPLGALPPAQQPLDDETPVYAADITASLGYTLEVVHPPMRPCGEMRWLRYLHPQPAMATYDVATTPIALDEVVSHVLTDWLTDTFPIATVGDAIETARHGPVGHFGPVEARVLKRTGQADLAVDATWLGEADNANQQGGEATSVLTLYGERYGAWLLHRRSAVTAKARSKQDTPPPAITHEVMVAESADQLMEHAGLGCVEKRLFQQANILPHATLWPTEADADATTAGGGVSATLDLSGVPDRAQRHLQAIALLTRQGKLSAADTDLLYKIARQLSRPSR